eukprot:7080266-Pyramimonas_sp.AAC.1
MIGQGTPRLALMAFDVSDQEGAGVIGPPLSCKSASDIMQYLCHSGNYVGCSHCGQSAQVLDDVQRVSEDGGRLVALIGDDGEEGPRDARALYVRTC